MASGGKKEQMRKVLNPVRIPRRQEKEGKPKSVQSCLKPKDILPSVEEYLTQTLVEETLSPLAEEKRLDIAGRLKALKLPSKLPSKEGEPEPNNDLTYGPETDLKSGIVCAKNPGHVGFIPVTEFSSEHLDESLPGESDEYKTSVVDYIKACADLTVLIKSRSVSKDRPDLWKDTGLPYPSSHARGGNHTRTGSGYVKDVTTCGEGSESYDDETCPCKGCCLSHNPCKTWWKVGVTTARHVTFDQAEIEGTEVSCFLDERNSVGSVCVVQALKDGDNLFAAETEKDYCDFNFITHDVNIGDRLKKAKESESELKKRYEVKKLFVIHSLTAVIGHPHGCSKHITLGRQVEWLTKSWNSPLIHSAKTCRGCSGGTVLGRKWTQYDWVGLRSHHSEGLFDGNAMTSWW